MDTTLEQSPEPHRYTADDRRSQLLRLAEASAEIGRLLAENGHPAAVFGPISARAAALAIEPFDHDEVKTLVREIPSQLTWLDPRNPGWQRDAGSDWIRAVGEFRSALDQAAIELRAWGTRDVPTNE